MVPGSTFRYGSNFIRLTVMPRLSSRHPIEAAASPLPSEDTTPPVTKMYFADIVSSPQLCWENCAGWCAQSIMTDEHLNWNLTFAALRARVQKDSFATKLSTTAMIRRCDDHDIALI